MSFFFISKLGHFVINAKLGSFYFIYFFFFPEIHSFAMTRILIKFKIMAFICIEKLINNSNATQKITKITTHIFINVFFNTKRNSKLNKNHLHSYSCLFFFIFKILFYKNTKKFSLFVLFYTILDHLFEKMLEF
jgi:hypothetical protein